MSITLYHGTNQTIEHPDCKAGRRPVDFGQGFYLTDTKEQAAEWARRIADNRGGKPQINLYTLNREGVLAEGHCKIFTAYDEEWLDFVVKNRQLMQVEEFDYIEGGVANDRIIDTVRLYMLGLMPLEATLRRLIMHKPNNQICLRNQTLTDKYLIYNGTEPINDP